MEFERTLTSVAIGGCYFGPAAHFVRDWPACRLAAPIELGLPRRRLSPHLPTARAHLSTH